MGGRERATQEIPILDHVNQAMLDHLAADDGPPIYTLTPEEARSILLRAQSGHVGKPDAQVKGWNGKSGPHTLRLRTIRPHSCTSTVRGGSWVTQRPTIA